MAFFGLRSLPQALAVRGSRRGLRQAAPVHPLELPGVGQFAQVAADGVFGNVKPLAQLPCQDPPVFPQGFKNVLLAFIF